MNGLATAKKKEVGPHEKGGPMVDPKACILARFAEPGHRPMRPLARIARIHMAGLECNLLQVRAATLQDGRNLSDLLKSTLNGDGGICRDLVGKPPGSRDSLLKKTLDEINLLLNDRHTPLESVMPKEEARILRECLAGVATSLLGEIEMRREAAAYLEWMGGGNRGNPNYPPIDDSVPKALKGIGSRDCSEGAVIGHGV